MLLVAGLHNLVPEELGSFEMRNVGAGGNFKALPESRACWDLFRWLIDTKKQSVERYSMLKI